MAKYRGLGIVLLILSVPCLIAGIIFQFAYPTHSCVATDFFGNCTQMGTTYPWAGAGDALLFFFALFVLFGLIFAFWKTTPVRDVYHPVYQVRPSPVSAASTFRAGSSRGQYSRPVSTQGHDALPELWESQRHHARAMPPMRRPVRLGAL